MAERKRREERKIVEETVFGLLVLVLLYIWRLRLNEPRLPILNFTHHLTPLHEQDDIKYAKFLFKKL